MSTKGDGKKCVVVGAGPVGSLAALYAAHRGYDVEIYDLRGDLRHSDTTPLNFTKSINLALSERGINSIRLSGHESLLQTILARTLPMDGRMIHTRTATGQLDQESQIYDVHGNVLRSVDRGEINVCMLNELDMLPNVKFCFQHKLTGADFRKKKAWFEDQTGPQTGHRRPEIEIDFDLMLGCDGAHSAVRYHMMKYTPVNYHQEYIDCLWCEFAMSPTSSNDFRMSPRHLHIWPAGESVFIALPNLDKSFVCTLFAPVSLFRRLEDSPADKLIQVFDTHFPGVTDFISEDDLVAQFKRNPHLPLINIKCSPHHYGDSVVILGDAANAMVPFYGQGMNAGLESVRVLFHTIDQTANVDDLTTALATYTRIRTADTHAIADLALGNYHEMSSAVTSPVYKLRKYVEERLHKYMPALGWSTQYSRVTFSNMPYSRVIERSAHQKRVLLNIFASTAVVLGSGLMYGVLTTLKRRRVQ